MSSPFARAPLRVLAGGGRTDQTPTDEAIVAAVVARDPKIAAFLYDRITPAVDRALYRVFGRREAGHEDLIQTTLEQVVRTLASQRYAGACSLPTWASAIATHVGLNALRSRRRERRVFEAEGFASSQVSAPSEVALPHARLALLDVRTELAAMNPDRANAVFLHDVLGHELAEIAVTTGVSVAAAQSRLVRGRKELMQRLKKQEGRP